MTMDRSQWEEKLAHLRHELHEALNYFKVAKMNLDSARPDKPSIDRMFKEGEAKLKEVIESLKTTG